MRFFSTLAASTLGAMLAIVLFMFFGFLFIVALAASSDPTPTVRTSSVLVLPLQGDIPERVTDDPFARMVGLEASYGIWDVTEGLRKAAADSRIDALWIKMRGGGISWARATELRAALEQFKESGKPIIASSEDFPVTENALYLATVADSVFAGPGTFVEFNGFYIQSAFYKGLLDKLDVEPQIVRAGEYKSAVEPFERTSLSQANAEQLRALLATQEANFVDTIAKSRGLDASEIRTTLAEFGIGSSEDALSRGLIDGLRHADEAERAIKLAIDADLDDDLTTINMREYVRVPATQAGLPRTGSDEIAVVYMQGTIVSGSGYNAGFLTPGSVRAALRRAAESERVKAIVLRIDSPGGSAAASEAILQEIRSAGREKPVVVSLGSVAASGGYWIAMGGDYIFAESMTLTGSIGVFSLFFDAGDLYADKLGITHDVLRTAPQADMLSGMRPFTALERQRMQQSVDETYAAFLELVSVGRELDVDRVRELAGGRVWTGLDAKEVDLIDEIGGLQDAIAFAAETVGLDRSTVRLRILPKTPTFFERLNESLSVRAQAYAQRGLTSLEKEVLAQARELGQLLQEHGTIQARVPFDIQVK